MFDRPGPRTDLFFISSNPPSGRRFVPLGITISKFQIAGFGRPEASIASRTVFFWLIRGTLPPCLSGWTRRLVRVCTRGPLSTLFLSDPLNFSDHGVV